MRHEEWQLQQEVFKTLRDKGWVVFHIPNERNGGVADARRMKAGGVVKGAPDLVGWVGCNCWWFELKTPKGKRSIEQECMEEVAERLGINYRIIRTLEDIEDLV